MSCSLNPCAQNGKRRRSPSGRLRRSPGENGGRAATRFEPVGAGRFVRPAELVEVSSGGGLNSPGGGGRSPDPRRGSPGGGPRRGPPPLSRLVKPGTSTGAG